MEEFDVDDYLQHWGIAKGGKAKNHKYYMRVNSGNPKKPYLYFYSAAEYQAWLNKGSTDPTLKAQAKQKEGILDRMRNIADKALDSFKDTVNNVTDPIKKALDKNGNGKLDAIDKIENKRNLKKIEKAAEEADKKSRDKNAREKNERNSMQDDHKRNKREKKESQEGNGHEEPPKNHKYVAKILVNGKYRYFYDEKELEAFYNKNPQYSDKEVMSEFDLIDPPETEEESQSEINKNYDQAMTEDGFDKEPGWSNNCYDCTLAYEARKRGYDVEAMYDTNGETDVTQSEFYEGVKPPMDDDGYFVEDSGWDFAPAENGGDYAKTGKETMEQTADMLNDKYPDGARGNLCVYWDGGGGHSVAWEKKDGEIYIHDAQNNTTQKMKDYEYADQVAPNAALALRTDDKKFTKKAADYLQPNDDVDEAKGNKKLTYSDEEINTAREMVDHYNPAINQYVADNDEQVKRWQAYMDKMSELADYEYNDHETEKRGIYG